MKQLAWLVLLGGLAGQGCASKQPAPYVDNDTRLDAPPTVEQGGGFAKPPASGTVPPPPPPPPPMPMPPPPT